jgi:phenol 2-monooxygenase
VPDVTAPTARYPYEVTLHQGEIEKLFLDSMRKEGLEVERPIVPISLQISEDPKEIADPHAYPIKVRPGRFPRLALLFLNLNSFALTHRSC